MLKFKLSTYLLYHENDCNNQFNFFYFSSPPPKPTHMLPPKTPAYTPSPPSCIFRGFQKRAIQGTFLPLTRGRILLPFIYKNPRCEIASGVILLFRCLLLYFFITFPSAFRRPYRRPSKALQVYLFREGL